MKVWFQAHAHVCTDTYAHRRLCVGLIKTVTFLCRTPPSLLRAHLLLLFSCVLMGDPVCLIALCQLRFGLGIEGSLLPSALPALKDRGTMIWHASLTLINNYSMHAQTLTYYTHMHTLKKLQVSSKMIIILKRLYFSTLFKLNFSSVSPFWIVVRCSLC